MHLVKRTQLGLIHMAVAMTLVPINSTLNRVMIKEMGISATVVAILASLPFLLAPIQMAIGSFSDRHPLLGFRRAPYILGGLVLCALGVALSPGAALLMERDLVGGLAAGVAAFGAWGMGYNLSSVSYLSLASELSPERERAKTIATMWFMMILGIIGTAVGLSRLVDPYSPAAMTQAFVYVAVAALALGLAGLVRLEPRHATRREARNESYTLRGMVQAVAGNPVARRYFLYLLLLLAAILGQDVLLEPFGAEAFGLTVTQTTRITSFWGTSVLAAIAIAGPLESKLARKTVAHLGNLGALLGFLLILTSGILRSLGVFYSGVILLGLGTGLSTVANLSLMFGFTLPGQVGLFIGAWGFANALSRLTGSVLAGAVRDLVTQLTGHAVGAYLAVFAIEAAMLLSATLMLVRLDVREFAHRAVQPALGEKLALAADG